MGNGRVEMEVGADGVAVITIVNPPLNCLSSDVLFGLKENYEQALTRDDVKAIVLTGENGQFCGGFDINELENIREGQDQEPRDGYLSIDIITNVFEGARKPCVAAIGGITIGGGLEIAMASHARISTSNAQLGLPELQIGIIPGLGGTQRLPRLVGITKALEMLLLSKLVTGEEALSCGLVDAVAQPNELLDTARRWAIDITESKRPWVRTLDKTDKIEPLEEARNALELARIESKEKALDLQHHLICIDVIEEGIVSGPQAGLLKEASSSKALVFGGIKIELAKELIVAMLHANGKPQD